MKIRLEAFEDRRKMDSLSDEARAKEKLELDEHEEQFKEKLKTFQKISSRGELGSGGGTVTKVAEDKKPPPPLKYKDLINVSEKLLSGWATCSEGFVKCVLGVPHSTSRGAILPADNAMQLGVTNTNDFNFVTSFLPAPELPEQLHHARRRRRQQRPRSGP